MSKTNDEMEAMRADPSYQKAAKMQKAKDAEQHTFPLEVGEIIKIGGIPFRYVGNGKVSGSTTPEYARDLRDNPVRVGHVAGEETSA